MGGEVLSVELSGEVGGLTLLMASLLPPAWVGVPLYLAAPPCSDSGVTMGDDPDSALVTTDERGARLMSRVQVTMSRLISV